MTMMPRYIRKESTAPKRRSFRFLGYELREATPDDLALATEWTLADPEHKDSITPDFWIQSEPITNGDIAERYILIDPAGAVFFLRLDKAIRIYMQFSPDKSADAIERNREAMTQGFRWLSAMLTIKSIAEVIFDSQVQALRAFCGRRLGFKQKKNTLTKRLAVYTPASSTDEAPPAVTV
jgi:hypothetical protein